MLRCSWDSSGRHGSERRVYGRIRQRQQKTGPRGPVKCVFFSRWTDLITGPCPSSFLDESLTFALTQTPIFPRRCKASRACADFYADFCADFCRLILSSAPLCSSMLWEIKVLRPSQRRSPFSCGSTSFSWRQMTPIFPCFSKRPLMAIPINLPGFPERSPGFQLGGLPLYVIRLSAF